MILSNLPPAGGVFSGYAFCEAFFITT